VDEMEEGVEAAEAHAAEADGRPEQVAAHDERRRHGEHGALLQSATSSLREGEEGELEKAALLAQSPSQPHFAGDEPELPSPSSLLILPAALSAETSQDSHEASRRLAAE